MERKEVFRDPEIISYDREELDFERALTTVNESDL
jgi:hypothetical protein